MLGGPVNDVVELGVDGCDHCCSPLTIIVSASSSGGIVNTKIWDRIKELLLKLELGSNTTHRRRE